MLTPIQKIESFVLKEKNIHLFIKREDLNHPTIQGNKFRKLKYNLAQAKADGKKTLLTFGGAFSNHIYATAAAGTAFGFSTIGIIRGEKPKNPNPTLLFAEKNGMQLHFISRSEYKEKQEPTFISQLKELFGDFYLIPEGGTNDLAIKGCEEIPAEVLEQKLGPDYYTLPVGTGGTITGIISGLAKKNSNSKIIGFPSLKGDFLKGEIEALLKSPHTNWKLQTDYHFGGYAKHKPELISFINEFKELHNIPLDPIYTGKMMFGIFDLIKKGFFPRDSTILAIHTGGLQGIEGFNNRFGNILD